MADSDLPDAIPLFEALSLARVHPARAVLGAHRGPLSVLQLDTGHVLLRLQEARNAPFVRVISGGGARLASSPNDDGVVDEHALQLDAPGSSAGKVQ